MFYLGLKFIMKGPQGPLISNTTLLIKTTWGFYYWGVSNREKGFIMIWTHITSSKRCFNLLFFTLPTPVSTYLVGNTPPTTPVSTCCRKCRRDKSSCPCHGKLCAESVPLGGFQKWGTQKWMIYGGNPSTVWMDDLGVPWGPLWGTPIWGNPPLSVL